MTKLILIRHGYSRGNREQIYTGQLDLPLEPLGERQADCTAAYICSHYTADAVYASDLSRAIRTVQPIADTFHLPIRLHAGLREVHDGDWHGRKFAELKENEPEKYEEMRRSPGTFQFPNGESFLQAQVRGLAAIREIVAENPGKTVVIGAHNGILRVLLAAWLDIPLTRFHDVPRLSNGSVSVVTVDGDCVTVDEVNHDAHLASLR